MVADLPPAFAQARTFLEGLCTDCFTRFTYNLVISDPNLEVKHSSKNSAYSKEPKTE